MKTKLIGILVCMLLIMTTIPVVGMVTEEEVTLNQYIKPIPRPDWGLDQKQTSNCGVGFAILPDLTLAQSFTPTLDRLTAVQLHCFKYNLAPEGIKLTVSIRDNLTGSDLTTKTMDADPIKPWNEGTWVIFDFPDIDVTPENTYYIVCASDGGIWPNNYAWYFEIDNPYTRGEAWAYNESTSSWMTLWEFVGYNPQYPDPDYCFKTYTKKSHAKPFTHNSPILCWFFERFPNVFPVMQNLLGY